MSDFNGQEIQENIGRFRYPVYLIAYENLDHEASMNVVDDVLFAINSWSVVITDEAELKSYVNQKVEIIIASKYGGEKESRHGRSFSVSE